MGLLEFHVAHSEILLTVCADQLSYNLSLIKLYSACAKQNAAAKNASGACSFLADWTFSDLVGQHPSPFSMNFENVIKYFLVWNIYFTFFLPMVDCTFSQE